MGAPLDRESEKEMERKCMNFNEKKIIPIHDLTLKDMREFLATLPSECDDWKISCCGYTNFWVHLRGTEQAIIIDTEEFIN